MFLFFEYLISILFPSKLECVIELCGIKCIVLAANYFNKKLKNPADNIK